MRKFSILTLLALSLSSLNANADALGFFVGGGAWDHDSTGTFGTSGDDILNVESDLGYGSTQDTYVWAAFEHFVPLIPNIRIEAATIGQDGFANGVIFNGVSLTGSSEVKLDNVDAILYYRLLDNWVNFDFGLNIRQLDGKFNIDSETLSISETIPMLYLSAQFDLPFSGFSIGGDINTISYSGNSYRDIRIRAMYEIGVIGFEAGLKSTTLELDDVDNVTADLEFQGLMFGAFLHF
jgi:outer membrane protein